MIYVGLVLHIPTHRTREADNMVQMCVLPGSFDRGSEDGNSEVRRVTLDGYWLDQTEVTNGQYSECVEDGACAASRLADDSRFNGVSQPVVGVSWHDAVAYCEWAGARLSTEAEWEYAARGSEGREYPWGDEFDGTRLNYCDKNCVLDWADKSVDDGYTFTAPVGSYPEGASWVGAQDMGGNVWEWVYDWHGDYPSSAQTNPTGPSSGEDRVLRGGSWGYYETRMRAVRRNSSNPMMTNFPDVGFRCASPQSPKSSSHRAGLLILRLSPRMGAERALFGGHQLIGKD